MTQAGILEEFQFPLGFLDGALEMAFVACEFFEFVALVGEGPAQHMLFVGAPGQFL